MDMRWAGGRFVQAVGTAVAVATVGVVMVSFTSFASAHSAAADNGAPEFGYSGDNGPGFWHETPGWEACAGTSRTERQSPIDIDEVAVDRHLGPLRLQLRETALALTNNGHTVEEEYEPGSSITLGGVVYGLSQFHFHTLSEHTVAGQHAVMELHAVFADPASSNKAVVGMLFTIGKTNRFLTQLLSHGLPKKSGDVVHAPSPEINLADALTNTSRYYTYPGSLTTPPCTETVTWFVLHDYAQLSNDQFEAFRSILGNNFRPVQKRNNRVIRSSVGESDHSD